MVDILRDAGIYFISLLMAVTIIAGLTAATYYIACYGGFIICGIWVLAVLAFFMALVENL